MKIFSFFTLLFLLTPIITNTDENIEKDNQEQKLSQIFDPETLKEANGNEKPKHDINTENPEDVLDDISNVDLFSDNTPQKKDNPENEIPHMIDEDHHDEKNSNVLDMFKQPGEGHNGFGETFYFGDQQQADVPDIGDESLQQILNEFSGLDCNGEYKDETKASNYVDNKAKKLFEKPIYCSAKIKDEIFKNLSALGYSPAMLNTWIIQNIYKPLAYKVDYNFSYASILNSLFGVGKKYSLIHPEMQITNNRDFQNMVMKTFETIEDASSNFFNNKGQISNIILDLLKKFHIYWNVHRQRQQMDHLHDNTMTIMKNLFDKYKQTNDAMKAVTLHLLKNINEAYSRFIRADKMQSLIKANSAEMIVIQLLRRTKANVERLHQNNLSNDMQVIEYANLLDMLEGFFLVNDSNNIKEDQNQNLYQKFIFEKIKEIYEVYIQKELNVQGQQLYLIKDFIATLLLKFEHRKYLIFRIYGISGIKYKPIFKIEEGVNHPKIIEIFLEFQDRLLLIPQSCIINISYCTEAKIGGIIFDFYTKYQLFSETQGAHLLEYLRQMKGNIIENIKKKKGFDSYNNYRNLYYSEVFKQLMGFILKYNIKRSGSLNKLQELIGNYFENKKSDIAISEINRKILGELDETIYFGINKIYAKMNYLFPVDSKPRYLTQIQEELQNIIQTFYVQNKVRFNQQSKLIINDVQELIQSWKLSLIATGPQKADESMTPGSLVIPSVPNHSDVVVNVVHEPMNLTNQSIPITQQHP